MALHVFANIVLTILTLPGAVRALANPQNSTVVANGAYQPNSLYMAWVFALHIYHPIFFKTGVMDWIHHVPVYILNMLTFSIPTGNAIHLQGVNMVGIPGGIDYLLQVLEGEGKLSRARYKEYCCVINTWVRAPFGAVASYVSFVGLYHGWHAATAWQAFVFFFLGLHAFWNPPFFCRQAVEANIVDVVNRFGLVGGDLKLPKIRSMCGKQHANASPKKRVEAYPVREGMDLNAKAPSPLSPKAKAW
jgi:hypothetical protein